MMKPYRTIKLIEFPDIADIQAQGRKSSVGRLPEKGGDFKPYVRSAKCRASARRALKKADKNELARIDRRDAKYL
jgi:hypothetical protein